MQTFFFNFFFFASRLLALFLILCFVTSMTKSFCVQPTKRARHKSRAQKAKSGAALYTLHGTTYTYIYIYLYSCLAINISACHERTNEPETKGIKNP